MEKVSVLLIFMKTLGDWTRWEVKKELEKNLNVSLFLAQALQVSNDSVPWKQEN